VKDDMRRKEFRTIALAGFSATIWLSLLGAQTRAVLPEPVGRVFARNCTAAGCHSGAYPAIELNLEPDRLLGSAFDRPSREKPGLKILDPADPGRSYLLAKLRGEPDTAGKRMPLDKPPLPEADLKLVAEWVAGLKSSILDPADASRSGERSDAGTSAAPAFWGSTIINLPTALPIEKGRFSFRISHRFLPPVGEGFDQIFGLDGPGAILFGFGYGLTDRLSFSLGRTNNFKEFGLGARWAFLDQGRWPFAAALHVGGSLATGEIFGRTTWDSRNIKVNIQLSLVRQVTERLSLAVIPSFSTHTDHWQEVPQNTFGLGLGGRFMVLKDLSLLAEWTPVLAGYAAASNGWGFGLEKKIGGHVFQFFVLNSIGLTPDLYLPGGDLRLGDGDLRLGFNIYRMF
jgi:hypothetical protein